MGLGVYMRDVSTWREIPDTVKQQMEWVVCGDYGCFEVLPSVAELLELKQDLRREKIQLHYLSPKVTEATIDRETERVLALLEEEIHVTINDWGLFYQLRSHIRSEHHIYIGRLLTKSITDWAWASIILAKEEQQARDYLVQNNFQHRLKANFLKQWGIKGVEVSIDPASESSFAQIQAQGLAVIGYADHSILALSRACPLARLKGMNLSQNKCSRFCKTSFQVVPIKETQREIYPAMELWGTMVSRPQHQKPRWTDYQKIIYRWTPDLETRLTETHSI